MTKKVTKKQQVVLNCIAEYINEKGYSPTVRDLCDMLHLHSPSTIHVHLKSLEELGLIKRDPHKSRSIILTDPDSPAIAGGMSDALRNTLRIPLVGNVAAGTPILAEENITEMLTVPTQIVGDAASFLLQVQGDSMIDIGINDGDYVVVKQQPIANNGDIVVALVDDGATVKRFYREKDCIRLQPENSRLDPIIVDDCVIAGKVIALFRRM